MVCCGLFCDCGCRCLVSGRGEGRQSNRARRSGQVPMARCARPQPAVSYDHAGRDSGDWQGQGSRDWRDLRLQPGLRQANVLGLRWSEVDPVRNTAWSIPSACSPTRADRSDRPNTRSWRKALKPAGVTPPDSRPSAKRPKCPKRRLTPFSNVITIVITLGSPHD